MKPYTAVYLMGQSGISEMRKHYYSEALGAGSAIDGGMLAIMIPPSMIFIIYCSLIQESVGKLFIAGIIPGVLLTFSLLAAMYVTIPLNPKAGPRVLQTTLTGKVILLQNTWGIIVLLILVISDIYFGSFTPTEAAVVGACGAFIFTIGKKRLTIKNLKSSLLDTGRTTAKIFALLIAAGLFSKFLSLSTLTLRLTEFVTGSKISRFVIAMLIFTAILKIFP